MAIYLPETEYGLSVCRAHLDTYSDTDPSITSFLTRYLAVRMCAEIESVVTEILNKRVEMGAEPAVAAFVTSIRGNLIRNAKYSEIGDKLALFGPEFKRRYEEHVNSTIGEVGVSRLGIATGTRDKITHSTAIESDITFDELKLAYESAEKVVEAVAVALQPNVQA